MNIGCLKNCHYLTSAINKWDKGEIGRNTCEIVSRVSNKSVGWSREEFMFDSGYGPFPLYFPRFNLRTHDNCNCGGKEIQCYKPRNVP
ncbi:hypothetical protein AVEN_119768-1 [Araneus ventricosus]|uniref:Uncharacterized protein n=1 Tax=Araneus ventricosus TaxID=182803 RepID=A0A4Y2VUA2_ARAVE|nr:hypothetical protein AVEN_119768-1 [Araneus ventricosus]